MPNLQISDPELELRRAKRRDVFIQYWGSEGARHTLDGLFSQASEILKQPILGTMHMREIAFLLGLGDPEKGVPDQHYKEIIKSRVPKTEIVDLRERCSHLGIQGAKAYTAKGARITFQAADLEGGIIFTHERFDYALRVAAPYAGT